MEASTGFMKISKLAALPYQEKLSLTFMFKNEVDEEFLSSPVKV